MKFYKN